MRMAMMLIAGLLALMFLGGCSKWSYSKRIVYPDGRIEEIEARQEQVLIWKEMKDVEVVLGDGSWVAVGHSKMDSENAVEFVSQVKDLFTVTLPYIRQWLKVNP